MKEIRKGTIVKLKRPEDRPDFRSLEQNPGLNDSMDKAAILEAIGYVSSQSPRDVFEITFFDDEINDYAGNWIWVPEWVTVFDGGSMERED